MNSLFKNTCCVYSLLLKVLKCLLASLQCVVSWLLRYGEQNPCSLPDYLQYTANTNDYINKTKYHTITSVFDLTSNPFWSQKSMTDLFFITWLSVIFSQLIRTENWMRFTQISEWVGISAWICVCICVYVSEQVSVCVCVLAEGRGKGMGVGFTSVLQCYLSAHFFSDRLVGLVVKVSASRAEDSGFEFHLCQDFSGVESYQWLKNWHSSGYPARRLAL